MRMTFCFLFLSVGSLLCQDQTWVLGYATSDTSGDNGVSTLTFNSVGVVSERVSSLVNFGMTNASMCDDDGNLLFYTNGCTLYNGNHDVVPNGEGLYDGSGWAFDQFCEFGFNLPQGAIVLPDPSREDQYFLFHMNINFVYLPEGTGLCDTLFCTTVQVERNGNVTIAKKAEPVLTDTIELGHLSAIQKANGSDWWLMVPRRGGEEYYILDINDRGMETIHQRIGPKFTFENSWVGQSKFSPNGEYYVRYSPKDGVHVFEFNLSDGNLSKHRSFVNWRSEYKDDIFGGMSISQNSKLIYLSTTYGLYQTPIRSITDPDSLLLIDTFDGTQCPFFDANFFQSELAPNDKIYISAGNSCRYMHVINSPDKRGKACDFQQSGIKLVTYNSFTIPNFPVYFDSTLNSTTDANPEEDCGISAYVEQNKLILTNACCNPQFVNIWSISGQFIQQITRIDSLGNDRLSLELPDIRLTTPVCVQVLCQNEQHSFIIVR